MNSATIEEKKYDFQGESFTSLQKSLRLDGLEIGADPGMVGGKSSEQSSLSSSGGTRVR
jgi:hypothetical protein